MQVSLQPVPSPPIMVKLPPARVEQLKSLAASLGLSVTETVEHLINEKIDSGVLPDTLPGYEIDRSGRTIQLRTPRFWLPYISLKQAVLLADEIEAVADRAGDGGRGGTLGHHGIKIARKGRGVILLFDELGSGNEVQVSMTPGMARDLARQLRKAAA